MFNTLCVYEALTRVTCSLFIVTLVPQMFILFVTAQVLYQFTSVTSASSESADVEYPEPAASFVGGLGIFNLEMLSYVPSECIFTQSDFYTALTLKTIGPILIILLLWTKPLVVLVTGYQQEKFQGAAQEATVWSMLLLELCIPSVSTQISETFVCQVFPDEGE